MKSLLLFFVFFALFLSVKDGASAQETVATTSSTTTTVSYELPYPGMLPDSPFYGVKVVRDKLITFLINDPQKKIDFYLLQADKGIRAASMLVDKKNFTIAKETALKAEHNMTLIPDQLRKIDPKPSNDILERLRTASKKHQEVLQYMVKKTSGEDQKTFLQVLDFSQRNLNTIEMIQRDSTEQKKT